jgi:competence protein ComEA
VSRNPRGRTRIDINSARVEDLAGLPMIGEARAKAIVDHRNQYGRFATVDKLREVKGLGPATLTGIRNRVTAGTGDARLVREAAPIVVKAEVSPPVVPAGSSSGRVEIVLANGRRVIVDAGVDVASLARLVTALERP